MNKVVAVLAGVATLGAVVVVGLAAFIASQPGQISTRQSVVVNASAEDVRPYARDLKLWNEWSPWADIDPNVKQSFSEETAGEGAWYAWEGNDEVGKGEMTVLVDEPNRVVHEIAFKEPMEDVAKTTIRWEESNNMTTVTWTFKQQAGFSTKAANLVMDIEGMLAKDFTKGMSRLKPLVEEVARRRVKTLQQLAKAEEERKEEEANMAEEAP